MLKRLRGRRPEAVQVNALKKGKKTKKLSAQRLIFPFISLKESFSSFCTFQNNNNVPKAKKKLSMPSSNLFVIASLEHAISC
jgi:hypothetical protein